MRHHSVTKNLLGPYSAAPGTGREQAHTKSAPSSPQQVTGPAAPPPQLHNHPHFALHPERGHGSLLIQTGGKEGFHSKENTKSPSLPGSSSLTVGFRKISGTEGSASLSLPLSLSLSHTQALHTSPETPADMHPCPPVTLTLPCHRHLHTRLLLAQQAKPWRDSWLGTAPGPLGIGQGGEARGAQTSSHEEGEAQLTQTPGPRPRPPHPRHSFQPGRPRSP